MTATAPAPAVNRTGRCGAVRQAGRCPCTAVADVRTVGQYPTCACGHTVAVHALEEVAA